MAVCVVIQGETEGGKQKQNESSADSLISVFKHTHFLLFDIMTY